MSEIFPPEQETRLVQEFFRTRGKGFFVEVGANEPEHGSQSWHLEEAGWTGILIEPQPELAAKLRHLRRANVFAVACSSPENAGRSLPLHVAGPMSSLDRDRMSPGALPRLVLLEDHVGNLDKHRVLQGAGYCLVRRTGVNGWYVPADTNVDFEWRERWQVIRKYYLALPFRILRNVSRRLRQPFKDRRTVRDRSTGSR